VRQVEKFKTLKLKLTVSGLNYLFFGKNNNIFGVRERDIVCVWLCLFSFYGRLTGLRGAFKDMLDIAAGYNLFLKSYNFFFSLRLFFYIFFYINMKNKFLKIKIIILIFFQIKTTLKKQFLFTFPNSL